MKTSELTGAALDWAVAKCEGVGVWYDDLPQVLRKTQGNEGEYAPSDDWAQGGPIIERNLITIFRRDEEWYAYSSLSSTMDFHGATPLIAAMRCYVASVLGDEIVLPKELT
jgi:hypothetical protein